jgi:hypothetical protein
MDVTVTGRNVLPFEGAARVADGDAGVAAIIEPGAFIPPGAIAPEVKVLNSGRVSIDFPVVLRITADSGGLVYRDTAVVSGLAPGETLQVSFAAWPAQNGLYFVTCSTRLARDAGPANDTLSCRAEVVTHDVGVSRILAPRDSVWVGDTVIPQVMVCNFGSVPETVCVQWLASSLDSLAWLDYFDSATVAVPAQDSTPLDFRPWVPGLIGRFEVRSLTLLAGDLHPENDESGETLRVDVRAGIRAGNRELSRTFDVRALQNPARGQVTLEVSVATPGCAELEILNATGRRVATLLRTQGPSGRCRVTWSGNDQYGRQLGAGLYFARLATDSKVICRKVVLSR